MNYETRLTKNDPADMAQPVDPMDPHDGQPEQSRRRWIIIAVIVVAVLAAFIGWKVMGGEPASDTAADSKSQAPTVTVVTPGRTNVVRTITATGTLAARRAMPVGVAGEGGQVASVLVEAGQWVGQGQVLAIIDTSVQSQQSASQSAQIQVAEADARLAQANLDRALKLVDRGFISKADVDRLTATRDAASARVRVARAQLGELQARTRRLNIIAPSSGLILERNVEPGQVVSSGSGVLFLMAKGGEMELQAQLSEIDLASLSTGVSAKVVPVGTDTAFEGQVWQIAPIINAQSRQGIARIALPYDLALRPGGFATAEIISGQMTAPLLPESAILSDAKGSYVYLVGSDKKVARRDIKTGTVTADGIAVIEGLTGTEQIVLRAGGFLNPGETVNPVRSKAE